VFSARWLKDRVRTVPLAAALLSSSNLGKGGGSDEGGECPLGVVDLIVTDGGLFEGRDSNLGEALKILDGVAAKGVNIADLDDAVERFKRWSEGSPREG